jgi:hypothetical protein
MVLRSLNDIMVILICSRRRKCFSILDVLIFREFIRVLFIEYEPLHLLGIALPSVACIWDSVAWNHILIQAWLIHGVQFSFDLAYLAFQIPNLLINLLTTVSN